MTHQVALKDIHPLTDFQRNTKKHLQRLKKTKRPEVLTVNGKAEVVIIDATAYEAMLERISHFDTVEKLRAAMQEMDAGKGVPAEKAFSQIRGSLSSSAKNS